MSLKVEELDRVEKVHASQDENQEIGTVSGKNRENKVWETSVKGCGDEYKRSNRTSFMVDLFRVFHPDQRDAFTAWSTKVRARETNYGSRIDYILSTRDFAMKGFSECQVRPDIYGSDHCPVECVFKSAFKRSPVIPKSCSICMPELSGKQQNIKAFFKKTTSTSMQSIKRKADDDNVISKKQKLDRNDTTKLKRSNSLLSYFGGKPESSEEKNLMLIESVKNLDDDFDNLCKTNIKSKNNKVDNLWKKILKGPKPPPLCTGHKEPSVMHTVKKDSPNFGRQFFCCARPSGHANNKEARCKFFEWKT